ncbi:MAG: hypothetical protein LBG44_10495 [Gemmatimonadota bacterium]|jgi:hypothetical protein|nr:hypothetical protein [Gemmatimonadota bacterium]
MRNLMNGSTNFFSRVLPALFAVFAISAFAGTHAAQAQVSAADGAAFVGQWAVALDAQGQTFVLNLDITNQGGNLAAQVSSDMTPTAQAESIKKSGDKLVLSYTLDAQGQSVPLALTLSPTSAGLDATMNVADGMFTADGKGTRR